MIGCIGKRPRECILRYGGIGMNNIESTPTNGELFKSLAKAQSNFPVIPRDKTVKVTMKSGGSYSFAYAPLDTILHCVRKPLAENGLSVMQTIAEDRVTTILGHESGESISLAPVKILQSEQGAQALGSALTYARRYSLTLALGIVADEDDDGNGADGNGATTTKSSTQSGDTTSPSKDAEYLDRIKNELRRLFGDDKKAALDKIEELTAFKGKDDQTVAGVRDFTKLKGKRLEILCHNLEKIQIREPGEEG